MIFCDANIHCSLEEHVGMQPSKTSQTGYERQHNTFTPSYILCHFAMLSSEVNGPITHEST